MAIFMKQRLPAWVSWENAWDWLSYRKKTWEDPVDVQELRSGISFLSGKSKEQNLKRRGSGGKRRFFWRRIAKSGCNLRAGENDRSALQPQKNLRSLRYLCVSGFALVFRFSLSPTALKAGSPSPGSLPDLNESRNCRPAA